MCARAVEMLSKSSVVSYKLWEIQRSWFSREFMESSKMAKGFPRSSYKEKEMKITDLHTKIKNLV